MLEFVKRLFGSKPVVEEPKELEAAEPPALPVRSVRTSVPPPPPPPPPKPKRVAEKISEGGGSIEVDFVAVLDEGGIGEVDRDRITRAQSLLQTLPADAPAGLKRRIVEAAFSVFDVPTSKIIEASAAAIDVVRAYVKKSQEATETSLAKSEERIAQLEAAIRDERAAMERAKEIQRQRETLATAETSGIEPIVKFFTAVATIPPPGPEGMTPPAPAVPPPAPAVAPPVPPPAPKPPLPSVVPTKAEGLEEEVTAVAEAGDLPAGARPGSRPDSKP